MKVLIIGGGASGLVAAISAACSGFDVTILEKNDKCGKKILLTGNGRCNYFNDDFRIDKFNSQNLEILKKIINVENKQKILTFFDELGIVPKKQNGYYYPFSNQAITIRESLVTEAKLKGVKIKTNITVDDITYQDKFHVKTKEEELVADIVVLATGSKACPKTGSDGLGYILATNFNHHIVNVLPALVQLKSNLPFMSKWDKIRSDVEVKLYEDNQLVKEEVGEIQFTNYGVSGICIFQLSSMAIKGLQNNKKEEIVINFMPWLKDSLITYLDNKIKKMHKRKISDLLDGMLNYKIVNLILQKNHIDQDCLYNNLSFNQKQQLALDLQSFKVPITGFNGFDKAQVCSGGVCLSEINISTMESLKQKNLYIIGELLDVDGLCGGYNLSFAWLSALLAGEDIRRKNDKIKTN